MRTQGKSDGMGAVIREINGQLVLDDPVAMAVINMTNKINCQATLKMNADRVKHFQNRLVERGLTADQAVIVVINVDDIHGGPLAEILMPGFDWQSIRDKGEVPFARGLAERNGIEEALSIFDKEAATKLRGMKDTAVVVVDYGVAEIFAT